MLQSSSFRPARRLPALARALGALAVTLATLTAAIAATPVAPDAQASTSDRAAASPLLAIDRNRATVVDRVVRDWGAALVRANVGVDEAQLRALLMGMRADQLLAASLAGSLDGLRDVIANAISASEKEVKASLLSAKTLGDPGTDVVYVPVTPCRLVDTRAPYPAVYQGGGPFAANEVRTYVVEGGNGMCLSQLPASATPAAVQLQVFGMPTTTGSGDIEVIAQGGAFGATATLVFIGNNMFTSASTAAPVNLANKAIGVQVRGAPANVAIDVVGYFRAPQGGFVSSVTAGAGLTGGATGGNATLGIDATYVQRRVAASCAAGASIRAIAQDGTVTCQTDHDSGTVTSVGTGTGLTGGPITGSGTIAIAPGGVSTTELADLAVTQAKRAPLGSEYVSAAGQNLVTTVLSFLAPTATVVLDAPRPVLVMSGKALGSTVAGGASGLNLYICTRTGADPLVFVGQGVEGLRVAQNTRYLFGMSAVVTSLGAGTHSVGLCGASSTPADWNDFEYGYTTAVIL